MCKLTREKKRVAFLPAVALPRLFSYILSISSRERMREGKRVKSSSGLFQKSLSIWRIEELSADFRGLGERICLGSLVTNNKFSRNSNGLCMVLLGDSDHESETFFSRVWMRIFFESMERAGAYRWDL